MMTVGFRELLIFMAVLLAAGVLLTLGIVIPFLWYLNKKDGRDRDQRESCHNFQRELNKNTLIGFNKNSEALNLNTQVLNTFMERMGDKLTLPTPIDKPKG